MADVVFTVRVAVCAVEPLIVADVGMLHVAGSLAAVGVTVTAQLRVTMPVNPFEGASVIVDVFPVVAPGATLTAVPVIEKSGVGGTIVYVALDTALWSSSLRIAIALNVVVDDTIIGLT